MKAIYLFVIILLELLFTPELIAEWYLQNPQITAHTLSSIEFVDADTGFIGGDYGVILSTVDAGKNWSPLDIGIIDDINKIVYTGKFLLAACDNGKIIYSSDLGATWSIFSFYTDANINDIFFVDSTLGWAIFSDSIATTSNGGLSWKAASISDAFIIPSAIYFSDAQTGWMTGAGGIFKSVDGGINWTRKYDEGFAFYILTDICFVDENTGYVVGDGGTTLKTTNGGENWEAISIFTYDMIHCISLFNGTFWAGCCNEEIHALYNGEKYWEQKHENDDNSIFDIHFSDNNTGWAVGYGGSILKSTDAGETWNNITAGYGYYSQNDITFTSANDGWTVNDEGNIYHTINGGKKWECMSSGVDVPLYQIFFHNKQSGWIVGESGTILNTTDGGITWINQSGITTENLYDVYFSDSNNGVIIGGSINNSIGLILKTQNGGADWERIENPADDNLRKLSFLDANTGWACGYSGNIIKTTDGGTNWSKSNIATDYNLYAIDFQDSMTGWAAGEFGNVFLSTDGGIQWEFVDKTNDFPVLDIFVWKESPFFVGENGSYTYWSVNNYNDLNGILSYKFHIQAIYVMDENTAWVVGARNTIFSTFPGELGIMDETSNKKDYPSVFPNPITNKATLCFNLTEASTVDITLIDMIGNTYFKTNEIYKAPGYYQYSLPTETLPEGCYFCKISSCNKIETIKIIVVR